MTRPAPLEDVPIVGDMVRLGQFLQLSGLVDTGGEAKAAILEGDVEVNGEVECRRGRQLHDGDIVGFDGRQVRVRA